MKKIVITSILFAFIISTSYSENRNPEWNKKSKTYYKSIKKNKLKQITSSNYLKANRSSCPSDLHVTAAATSSHENQAQNSIIASNNISNNIEVTYHAGNEVLFTNGFTIENGAIFRGYIEACNDNLSTNALQIDEINHDIKILPNPNNGIFKIPLESFKKGEVNVINLIGKIVFQVNFENREEIEISLQDYPKGVYIVRIMSEDKLFSKKVIKN